MNRFVPWVRFTLKIVTNSILFWCLANPGALAADLPSTATPDDARPALDDVIAEPFVDSKDTLAPPTEIEIDADGPRMLVRGFRIQIKVSSQDSSPPCSTFGLISPEEPGVPQQLVEQMVREKAQELLGYQPTGFTVSMFQDLTSAISRFYGERGFFHAQAFIPEQKGLFRGGLPTGKRFEGDDIVTIVIVEGPRSSVVSRELPVAQNDWFQELSVAKDDWSVEDQPIGARETVVIEDDRVFEDQPAVPQEIVVNEDDWDFEDQSISVIIDAPVDLNSFSGRPHSLVIGIFQLSDPNSFSAFAPTHEGAVFLLDKGRVDDTIVNFSRIVVRPGEQKTAVFARFSRVKYIGLIVGYSRLNPKSDVKIFQIPVALTDRSDAGNNSEKPIAIPAQLFSYVRLGRTGAKQIVTIEEEWLPSPGLGCFGYIQDLDQWYREAKSAP